MNTCDYYANTLHNPEPLKDESQREHNVNVLFRRHFAAKLKSDDDEFHKEMKALKALARTKAVALVCFCKPRLCHGDVIKEEIERQLAEGDSV